MPHFMRQKKIRGHKRLQKQIEPWRQFNIKLNIDNLQERQIDYVKIRISPWSSISLLMQTN